MPPIAGCLTLNVLPKVIQTFRNVRTLFRLIFNPEIDDLESICTNWNHFRRPLSDSDRLSSVRFASSEDKEVIRCRENGFNAMQIQFQQAKS